MGMEENGKFGYVTEIDAADSAKDIWPMANDGFANLLNTKTFPTSASTLYIASDDSADAGVEVTVEYLDSNGELQTVTQTLDGTDAQTAVSLGVSGLDANVAYLSGDTETHAGNIYIANNSSFTAGVPSTLSNTLAMIPAGFGQTQQAIYQSPSNKKIRLREITVFVNRSSGADGSAIIHLRVKPEGGSWRVMRPIYVTTADHRQKHTAGLVFEGRTQIVMRVDSVSDTDSNVTGEFDYELVDTN